MVGRTAALEHEASKLLGIPNRKWVTVVKGCVLLKVLRKKTGKPMKNLACTGHCEGLRKIAARRHVRSDRISLSVAGAIPPCIEVELTPGALRS